MRWMRLIGITCLFLFVGLVTAQEDLTWIVGLLPTGEDINIEKQLLQGSIEIAAENQVLNESFSAVNAWDTVQDRDGFRRIREERYEMLLRNSSVIYTGIGVNDYEDVVITVDSLHLSEELNDGYGLVCRADDADNGYHFYISGDGYFRIFRLVDGRATGLTDWTASELIVQGNGSENTISAICVSDYLALYINGSLAAEVRDNAFASGKIGMSVILFTENSEVYISFDNLRAWTATTDAPRVNTTVNPTPAPTAAPTEVVLNTDEQSAALLRLLQNGSEDLELAEISFSDDFEDDSNWEEVNTGQSRLRVRSNVLQAFTEGNGASPAIILSEATYENSIIQVTTNFVDGAEDNAFGLVCRGSSAESGRGYYFNISSDGFYSIWASDGESFRFLQEWDRSLSINLAGENLLSAVCVNDYLAFYVNDTLLTEIYDSLYTSGTVGMMVYSYEGETEIAFDNLFIWEARLP